MLTAVNYGSTSYTNTAWYYFLHNSRGDITGVYNSSGTLRARYNYDSWGNVTVTDASGNETTYENHIGNLNKIRYKGYYQDTETGLYYLMSRYYDPQTHRFVNADGYFATGQGILDTNMNIYCMNNPINYFDPTGDCPIHLYWFLPTCAICNPFYKPTVNKKQQKKKEKPVASAITSVGSYNIKYTSLLFQGSPIKTYSGGGISYSNSDTGIFNAYHNNYNGSFFDSEVGVNFSHAAVIDFSLGFDDTSLSIGIENGETSYCIGLGVSLKTLTIKLGWDTCQSINKENVMNEGGIAIDAWLVVATVMTCLGAPVGDFSMGTS